MCDVVSAVGLAISAVSAYVGYEQQNQTAKAQQQIVMDGYEKERLQTLKQYSDLTAAAQEDTSQRHQENLIEEARLKAIGAESGLSGGTNERIVDAANNQADRDLSTIEANRVRATEQAHSQGVARQTSASVQLTGIRKPSALAAGLQIAGEGVSRYMKKKEAP